MFSSNTSGPGVATDPQFNYVTMLLHGNGTNGAQNNTFLDSSTNNFTITRNGNTTQGTFSPYGSNWSNYFDGSGDWLSVPDNNALDLSGDFTIEFWLNLDSGNVFRSGVVGKREQSTWTNGVDWVIRVETTDGKIGFGYNSAGNYYDMGTYVVGEWAHYAITRSGSSIKTFKNGTQVATATDSSTYTNAEPVRIGINVAGFEYKGYISNMRIVKGTAVYTSAFTPSTSPLTAITNTSLLTCQSNRFVDNSTNNFTITRNGNTSIQRFSPFNPTAPYAAGTDGGSGYFDGTGDNLTVANNAALYFGTGDFTIECWIYTSATVSYQTIATVYGAPTSNNGWYFSLNSAGTGLYLSVFNGSSSAVLDAGSGLNDGAWHHVAAVRTGTTLSTYIDGARVATTTNSFNITATSDLRISGYPATSRDWNGYISNFRIIKGSGPYSASSSTLTVPAAPLTAITNTSLLLNFTNAGILDNAEMNNLETVGNAQISTAQSKFGGGSMLFDGSGDYLTLHNVLTSNLGSAPFTVELWVYFNSASGTQYILSNYQSVTVGWGLGIASGNFAFWATGDTPDISTSVAAATGVWYHLAVSGQSGAIRLFLNGTQIGSTFTGTPALDSTATLRIGDGQGAASPLPFNGYIDDLRITKGYARYTANFTPPSAPFPDN